MKFGDIYIVNFEPSIGHEYGKTRPAIVIQEEGITKQSALVTVIPFSSRLDKIQSHDIFIGKDEKNRLVKDSVIKSRQISTFDKSRFLNFIGQAGSPTIRQVRGYLRRHFGF